MSTAIGIFGGTFDPLHVGHLHIARTALAALPLARVLWMPSGDPGHRQPPIANGAHRLAMLRLATANEPRFEVDPAEVESGAPTFSVPMLIRLRARFGAAVPLVLISGADSFLSLPTWYRWRELFDLASIAVAARPGHPIDRATMDPALRAEFDSRSAAAAGLAAVPAGRITVFPLSPLDVSASRLRATLAAGERPADLIPPEVLAYIEASGLYRSTPA